MFKDSMEHKGLTTSIQQNFDVLEAIQLYDQNPNKIDPVNLQTILDFTSPTPYTGQDFRQFINEQGEFAKLLIIFYDKVVEFEKLCYQHEETFGIQPPPEIHQPYSNKTHSHLRPSHPLPEEERESLNVIINVARNLIDMHLDKRAEKYIGIPQDFYDAANRALEAKDSPWTLIFSQSKQYTFNRLNASYFAEFIQLNKSKNISTNSCYICLGLGIFFLMFGFTFALTLIFLDFRPLAMRLILIPPTLLGFGFILASYSSFFPILGLLGKRETDFLFLRNIESQKVLKYQRKLALIHLGVIFGITTLITTIFLLLPGNHLMRSVK